MVTSGFHPLVTMYIFLKSSTANKQDFYFFKNLENIYLSMGSGYIYQISKENEWRTISTPAIQEKVTGMLLVALEHVTHASVTLA